MRRNLIGEKFGKLEVIGESKRETSYGNYFWICICDCGNKVEVVGSNLKNGHTKSCGCFQRQRSAENSKKHGMYKTRSYKTYQMMLQRCYNPNYSHYHLYGGCGIFVCERWRNSFQSFYLDMGERPKDTTLDRIKNNDGYYRENCRWVDQSAQIRNQSRVKNAKGYTFCKKTGKYIAQISQNKKNTVIGRYETSEEAHKAYLLRRQQIHD